MFFVVVVSIFVSSVIGDDAFSYKLPNIALPVHYDVEVEPSFKTRTFQGSTNILIEVLEETSNLTLHSKNLEFLETKVLQSDASEIPITNIEVDVNYEWVAFHLSTTLTRGLYNLVISFKGLLNQDLKGLYVSQYADSQDNLRLFALTNLQYTNARLVFPCFDEPSYPATFAINIIRPNNYVSLSNAELVTSEDIPDTSSTKDYFEITETISPYMVSFAIIDFEVIDTNDFKVYVLNNAENKYGYMVEELTQVLTALNELHPQNVGKLDHVVVADHALATDSLVSPGLIFYRESAVSFIDSKGTTEERQSIFKTISIAVAKQWHILATQWTDFWLVEGAAGFYHHEVASYIEPSWRLAEQFAAVNLHPSLERDYGENARTVSFGVNSAPDITLFSEPIFYIKSASLVMMFENSSSADITEVLTDPAMLAWSGNEGYPLVNVVRNDNFGLVALLQETFLSADPDDNQLWRIPIRLASSTEEDLGSFTVIEKQQVINLAVDSDSWLLIYRQGPAYFRVNYDTRNWELITSSLQSGSLESISPINRAQLIDDAFNLAEVGQIGYEIYLNLTKYVQNEVDYVPLFTFFKTTARLKSLLSGSDVQEKFMNYVKNLLENLYNELGTNIKPFEPHVDRLNRIQILKWLCNFEHESCKEEMFQHLSSFQNIHPDIEEAAYCGGMRLGNISHFLFLSAQYTNYRKIRILNGMGCTSDQQSLTFYLQAILDESLIFQLNPDHKLEAFSSIYEGSDIGRDLALDFIRDNLNKISQSFSDDQVSEMIKGLSKNLYTQDHQDKIDEIVSGLTEELSMKYLDLFNEAKSTIRRNIEWNQLYLNIIDEWIDQSSDSSTTTTTSPPTTTSTSPTTTTSTSSPTTTPSKPPTEDPTPPTEEPDSGTMIQISLIITLLWLSLFMCTFNKTNFLLIMV